MSEFNFKDEDIEYMMGIVGTSFLKHMTPAARLAGLSVEECLSGLSAKDRLSGLSVEEMVPYLKPEEVMPHFKLEDIWAGLSPEERQKLMELGRAN